MLTGLAVGALLFVLLLIVGLMVVLVVQHRVRRQAGRTISFPRRDPVDGHAASAVTEFDVERLRLLAAEDGAQAAFTTPGKRKVDAFLAEVFGPRGNR